MKFVKFLFVLVVFGLPAQGCDEGDSALGIDLVRCSVDEDCPEGLVCTGEGVCVTLNDEGPEPEPNNDDCVGPECEQCDPMCRVGERCLNGVCICTNGTERTCGVKGGECLYGSQVCTDGAWSQCVGGVDPVDEICDFKDNDCDGTVDEGVETIYFRDVDNDGWGSGESLSACEARDGFSEASGDCDDNDPEIHPLAPERCDGVDDDCNEVIDDPESLVEADVVCNQEGVCEGTEATCQQGAWACVYDDPRYEEGEEVTCDSADNDCDGAVDEGLAEILFPDEDEDGYGDLRTPTPACDDIEGLIATGGDCDDDDDTINPEAQEVCDGIDNDCDQLFDIADEDLAPSEVACNQEGVCEGTEATCFGRDGWVCIYPEDYQARIEVSCDGLDNDCDGEFDEGLSRNFFPDADEDGFGDSDQAQNACRAPQGFIDTGGDCDDDNPNLHPLAQEVCDGIDNNCNTLIDSEDGGLGAPDVTCIDRGVCAGTRPACQGPQGWQCNYDSDLFEPEEVTCDGLDNDCDGDTDEGLDAMWYFDGDSDGFGNPNTGVSSCGPPSPDHVRLADDCNDANTNINPDEDEICDGLDNDCDGRTDADDGSLQDAPTPCNQRGVCQGTEPTCLGDQGWLCIYVHPSFERDTETLCDDLDNNCDGQIDEGIERACGTDVGVCTTGVSVCVRGEFGACSGNQGIPPTDDESLADLCEGQDNDCDGQTDEGCACRDGDEVSCGTNIGQCTTGTQLCVDGDFGACSGQGPVVEFCDPGFLDHNCDGQDDIEAGLTTAFYTDGDGDGFGTGPLQHKCGPLGPNQAALDGDCDDNDPNRNPGEAELCDGIDNNCNDRVDDNPQPVVLLCNQRGVCQGTEPTCQGAQGWQCVVSSPFYEPDTETTCDGLDNDCDGDTDEGLTLAFYLDRDGDGFGAGALRERCGALEPGQSAQDGDCDDDNGDIHPDATELPADGVDQNCDGREICFVDDDNDGYRPDNISTLVSNNLSCNDNGEALGNEPVGDCDDTERQVNPGADEICDNQRDDNCDGEVDEGCAPCDRNVDADFDGANECDDCDDTNGGVFPGADEVCNGLDDDCDGAIDEDFDQDEDNFSVCAINPEDRDCNDDNANINPGADENCGQDGRGDGVDDNCNGYIDEGCDPCDPNDTDNDGISECDGDCDPDNPDIFPGAEELCDGLDNDCNVFTTTNCDVSDPCNWPDEVDICQNDLICACIVNGGGQCQDEYICTALCNTSETGDLGDGCAEDQICLYDLLYSANVHGCAVVTDGVQGSSQGGETCRDDVDCRSNSCDRLCVGPGCNQRYCQDWCGSDAYCEAPGTFCLINRGSSNMDGNCWPDAGPFHDPDGSVGDSCTGDTQCDHGLCGNFSDGRYCTEGCCSDSDCGSGYTCSLRGDQILAGVYFEPPDADDCNNNNDCRTGMICRDAKCTWNASETTPMCQRDEPGQGARPAGSACNQNDDCASNFCEQNLGVCVDVCCSDAACPQGLTCEFQFVQTTSDLVTQARVCVNLSTDRVLERQ